MRLATYLTNRLIADAIISHEDEEMIKYGLESLFSNLLGISITLIIGAIFGYLAEGFILWFLFFPLRKNAGGYHADTRGKCLIISVLMLMIAFFVDSLIKRITFIYIIAEICFSVFIFAVAPVENHNKLLDLCEKREYRKRTRIILLGEEMLFLVAFAFRWEILASAVVMTFLIVSILLMAVKIKLLF